VREAAEGGPEHWDAFLRWWYSKPLWGRLAERTPAYARMMARRRASQEWSEDRGGVARSVLGMSLARQPFLWDFLRAGRLPTLMIHGAVDAKYAALGDEMRAALAAEGAPGAKSIVEVREGKQTRGWCCACLLKPMVVSENQLSSQFRCGALTTRATRCWRRRRGSC
jgi:hypothetical protein